ncbi:MAG TPA: hypothetical protein VEC12_05260 [Bacteroidia bacterium]|nr:hypothetical protein [Bacteroidia bacterium]
MAIVILFSAGEDSGNPTCWGILRNRLMNDSAITSEAGYFVRVSSPLPQTKQQISVGDTSFITFDLYAYYSLHPVLVTASLYKIGDSCFIKEYSYKELKLNK